jgi:hypothetical protein
MVNDKWQNPVKDPLRTLYSKYLPSNGIEFRTYRRFPKLEIIYAFLERGP